MRTTHDTIAAIGTSLGEAAIGIVRLSGPDAISMVDSFFRGRRSLLHAPSHSLTFGRIVDVAGDSLDEVLVAVMRAPHTYTGEDVVEINCHGGRLVVEAVLARALQAGARLAEAGEFTKRAFLHGRLDLAQAEAVIDIIRAKSPRGLQLAAKQLEGELSRKVADVRGRILHLLAHVQVLIDYPEEGIEELSDEELRSTLTDCRQELQQLIAGADSGRVYRDGIRLAIVGRPNVGKSSLLNALLGEERAIVTDIAGTTRDTIDAPALLGGVPVTLIDTAGLRQTEDPVERIGVERTMAALATADLVLAVVDGSQPITEEDQRVFAELPRGDARVPVIGVINKIDQGQVAPEEAVREATQCDVVVKVSALTKEGLDGLEEAAVRLAAGEAAAHRDAILVTRARHRQALDEAASSLDAALMSFDLGLTPDVISVDLQEAMASLGMITGESVSEEVVAHIFAEFCVGK